MEQDCNSEECVEYEKVAYFKSDSHDYVEIKPLDVEVDAIEQTDDNKVTKNVPLDDDKTVPMKTKVCYGILSLVIILLIVAVAVLVFVYMQSKTQGGRCKVLTHIQHGQINRSTRTMHGDTLEIECDKYSKLNGSNQITCLSSGMWSDVPACVTLDCGVLEIKQNMDIEGHANITTVGSTISLSCKDGFTLSGNNSIICQSNELWSETPRCTPVDCGKPNISNSYFYSEKTTYSTNLTVTCANGYKLNGSEIITCTKDGRWDDLPVCDPIYCDIPVIPAHAQTTMMTGLSYLSNVTLKCDSGFEMHGHSIIACTSDGNWTKSPVCKKIDFCVENTCQHGTCISLETNYTCNCFEAFSGFSCEKVMTDCFDLYHDGGIKEDGVYSIWTWKTHKLIKVYCDMTTTEGGWTVFQYRFDKSVDFHKNFQEYENGFGDLNSEFWLGLKYIQEIANQSSTYLRIDVEAENGTNAYETFDMFKLGPKPAYTLYIGSTISSLRVSEINRFGKRHNGSSFSTFDHDVDSSNSNCAQALQGGWWYISCFGVHLNGRTTYYNGFILNGKLRLSKMMMKRN